MAGDPDRSARSRGGSTKDGSANSCGMLPPLPAQPYVIGQSDAAAFTSPPVQEPPSQSASCMQDSRARLPPAHCLMVVPALKPATV